MGASLMAQSLPMQETQVRSLVWEDSLEKEKGTHYSILPWRSPWTKDPGRLQSMGLKRVGHNLPTEKQQVYIYVNPNLSIHPPLPFLTWCTIPRR